tara:strand:+ start:861 stop:1496 length:636 start_codon:yes stop_codon:yes gene_type:complete
MNIIFVKEGTLYKSLHVNNLYHSLYKYYPKARFICYTDDPEGVEIECVHIDTHLRKWWNKLALFSEHFPAKGECLLFDLDIKVNHDPSPYIKFENKLNMVSAYWKRDAKEYYIRHRYDTVLNSSVLTWINHPRSQFEYHVKLIYELFNTNRDYYMRKYKGIDKFIYNEKCIYGLHKDGILSRHETPLEGAAIESWNNVDFNQFGITVQKSN